MSMEDAVSNQRYGADSLKLVTRMGEVGSSLGHQHGAFADPRTPLIGSARSEDAYAASVIDVEMMLRDDDDQNSESHHTAMPVHSTMEGSMAEPIAKEDREMADAIPEDKIKTPQRIDSVSPSSPQPIPNHALNSTPAQPDSSSSLNPRFLSPTQQQFTPRRSPRTSALTSKSRIQRAPTPLSRSATPSQPPPSSQPTSSFATPSGQIDPITPSRPTQFDGGILVDQQRSLLRNGTGTEGPPSRSNTPLQQRAMRTALPLHLDFIPPSPFVFPFANSSLQSTPVVEASAAVPSAGPLAGTKVDEVMLDAEDHADQVMAMGADASELEGSQTLSESGSLSHPQSLGLPVGSPHPRLDTTLSLEPLNVPGSAPREGEATAVFGSPIPFLSQPVLSPARGADRYQSFALPSDSGASVADAATPQPANVSVQVVETAEQQDSQSQAQSTPQAEVMQEANASFLTPVKPNDSFNRLKSLSPDTTSFLDRLAQPLVFPKRADGYFVHVPSAPKKSAAARAMASDSGGRKAAIKEVGTDADDTDMLAQHTHDDSGHLIKDSTANPVSTSTSVSTPTSAKELLTPPSTSQPLRSLLSPQMLETLSSSARARSKSLKLEGPLAPVISPHPPRRIELPFPISPVRERRNRDTEMNPVDSSSMDISFQPNVTAAPAVPPHMKGQAQSRMFTPPPLAQLDAGGNVQTPSRIPVPSARRAGLPSTSNEPSLSTSTSSTSGPSSTISNQVPGAHGTSKLRHPTNIRGSSSGDNVGGAGTKIPRLGKKPYARPVSKLPKIKAVGTSVMHSQKPPSIPTPMSSLHTPTADSSAPHVPEPGRSSNPIQIFDPPPPPARTAISTLAAPPSGYAAPVVSPHSPIKTRRGRAKAQAQTASKQAAVEEELPPDAIIYEAPPIRQRSTAGPLTDISRNPNLEQPEDAASTAIEQPKLQSHRPAPPPPVGVIFSPPRPGLVLKQQGRLLKAEAASAAANNVGSPDTSDANTTVPEFSATAPLLQIFPAARPAGKGGRGRNTARSLIHPLGLDPTALRHITSSNTLKNQRYICSTLETLVVMKDGKRPESPTSKVKTILEKKKEEQERGRMERAARRIGNKLDLGDTGSVDSGDMEMRDFSEEPSDGRHTRAAGDEEDFESPQRPKVEQEDMDMEFENGAKPKKRVKWNKNLLHRFEMDENDFEGIRRGAEIARTRSASKGCLAARVILDSLGNVPDAEIPVDGLQMEQVVVTKVVYIDELPPSERPKRVAASKAIARIGSSA